MFPHFQMTDQKQRSALYSILALLVLLVLLLLQLLDLELNSNSVRERTDLPVSIRADSQADYGRDPENLVVPPVSEEIFQQIIIDLQGAGSPEDRISTLQVSLSMPVPTMTRDPLMPTSTPHAPTMVMPGTVTPQATDSPLPTDTMTAQPTSTSTLGPVTATPSATASAAVPPATKKPRPTQKPRPTRRP